jgi:hypothetical protein
VIRRKPAVYLVIVLPIFLVGGMLGPIGLINTYLSWRRLDHPIPNINGILIAVPAVALWIPITLLLSNVILHSVPYLRRVSEQYAEASGQPGYGESQRALARVALAMSIVCFSLMALGFLL